MPSKYFSLISFLLIVPFISAQESNIVYINDELNNTISINIVNNETIVDYFSDGFNYIGNKLSPKNPSIGKAIFISMFIIVFIIVPLLKKSKWRIKLRKEWR